jgi:alpha/beta superfamily hydrolase
MALDLNKRVSNANRRPILIIAADSDVIPMSLHINPLVQALKSVNPDNTHMKLINDDHSFSSSREELLAVTADFLKNHCK